jgi:hypothetical protein
MLSLQLHEAAGSPGGMYLMPDVQRAMLARSCAGGVDVAEAVARMLIRTEMLGLCLKLMGIQMCMINTDTPITCV